MKKFLVWAAEAGYVMGLAGVVGAFFGLVGGCVWAHSAATESFQEHQATLAAERAACLAGNANACTLYLADSKR
jgi:hypothetical protein